MRLSMTSQMAIIGMNISAPFLALETALPRIEMETTPSVLEIDSPKPRLSIDQSQCFADVSHRGLMDFALYCSEYSRSEFFRGLERRVVTGNNLAAIHTGFSVADLGQASIPEEKVFEIISVPSQPPRIDFDVQPVGYQFRPAQVNVQAVNGQIDNQFQWGKVEVYIEKPNHLDIEWLEDRIIDVKA